MRKAVPPVVEEVDAEECHHPRDGTVQVEHARVRVDVRVDPELKHGDEHRLDLRRDAARKVRDGVVESVDACTASASNGRLHANGGEEHRHGERDRVDHALVYRRPMRRWWVWCVAASLQSSVAVADTCPVPEGGNGTLAGTDAHERIDFLHRTVDEQAKYARTWKWAWFGIGSFTLASSIGLTIGWAAAGGDPAVQQANVVDNVIVSVFSAVTPVAALLFALRVESDAPAIDELLHQTGDGTAGTCLVLARMEELVAKGAAEEAFNTGWIAQVTALLGLGAMFGIMAVEAAVASTPSVRDAHWLNAALNTGVGLVLTEAQILTTPTGAISGYKHYLRGDLAKPKAVLSVAPLGIAPGLLLRAAF